MWFLLFPDLVWFPAEKRKQRAACKHATSGVLENGEGGRMEKNKVVSQAH
jgi:hypothetical protein